MSLEGHASWMSLEWQQDGQDLDCSIEELLIAQLSKAERSLAAQHQRVIQQMRQRLQATSMTQLESYIARLRKENETLRTRLALFAGSGDAAAGCAAGSMSNMVTNEEDQKLRNAARDIAVIRSDSLTSLEDSEEGQGCEPIRPDSSEKKRVPDPPSTQPLRLPGELDYDLMEEKRASDHGNAFTKTISARPRSTTTNWIQRRRGLRQDSIDKDPEHIDKHHAYQLLDVWVGHHYQEQGLENSVYSLHLGMQRRADTLNDLEDAEKEFQGAGSYSTYHQTGWLRNIVVHPYSPYKSAWDIGSLILVLYDMIMIPMSFFDLPESTPLTFMSWTTRIYWTIDMPLSFVSGYVTADGTIELRLKMICKRYSRGWLLLDVLVVGVDWLEIVLSAAAESLGFARLGKASRIFRILRMIRLLRMARMAEVITLLTERLNSEKLVIVVDILKLMIIMIGAGHLLACMWYAIANSTDGHSWLVEYEFKDKGLDMRYVMSLRWAISQFAGGMDEVTPKNLSENIYAIFVYLTAFWSGAVFLSILTSSMTQWYIIGSQQSQQLTVLRRYLSQNGISKKLALRVQRNAQHAMAEQQRAMPEAAVGLITKVSEPLKIELHFEMYAPNLAIHPFFHRYIEECPHVMRKVCHSAMQMSTVSTGDIIFNVGEIPAEPKMYIISRGKLDYKAGFSGQVTPVVVGQWVSEPSLWVQWVHRGTLSAVEDCLLFSLLSDEFQTIVGHFEHIDFDPRVYASAFVECLNEGEDVTDLPLPTIQAKLKRASTGILPSTSRRDVKSSSGRLSLFGQIKRSPASKEFPRNPYGMKEVEERERQASFAERTTNESSGIRNSLGSELSVDASEQGSMKGMTTAVARMSSFDRKNRKRLQDLSGSDDSIEVGETGTIEVSAPLQPFGSVPRQRVKAQVQGKSNRSSDIRNSKPNPSIKILKPKNAVSFVDPSNARRGRTPREVKQPLHGLRLEDLQPDSPGKALPPLRSTYTMPWADEQEV